MKLKKCSAALAVLLALGAAESALSANWLILQGTEPPGASDRARVWGFIQPEFQQTDGGTIAAGPWSGQPAVFNQIGPDLDSDSTFNIRRARAGVRGTALPIDPNINYFLLVEFGNNAITAPDDQAARISDASVTLNHIKGARVRIGQFKTPGAEEGLQAIHVFDYVNFTNVTNSLLLERHFDFDGSGTRVIPGTPPTFVNSGQVNNPNGAFGAFRDIGIQVFDAFRPGEGHWEYSYAAMIGNGNGIARSDNDDEKDIHLYLSAERIFGGKGPRREGWKVFGWYQDGEREITLEQGDADPTNDTLRSFDRTRWGLGTTFRRGKYRAAAEYIAADGMIFNGSDGGAVPGSFSNNGATVASWNVLPDEEADGWYVDVGYRVLPKLELDLRYDVLNRATEVASAEREFETLTIGAQYFINRKTRAIVNYEFRDAEAPNLAGSANPNRILDGIDDRFSIQLLAIF